LLYLKNGDTMLRMKKISVIAALIILIGLILWAIYPKSSGEIKTTAYIDQEIGFSIELPEGFAVADKLNTATTSSMWFQNASTTATSSVQLVVERFVISPELEKLVKQMGPGPVTQGLIENLWVDLGLNIIANERVTIGGVPFIHVHSTYIGKGSKKEVTQHMYFVFAPDYYYRLGVDVYSEEWEQNKEAILKAVDTFKVLK
jgi:hypothetical protein